MSLKMLLMVIIIPKNLVKDYSLPFLNALGTINWKVIKQELEFSGIMRLFKGNYNTNSGYLFAS